MTTDFKVGDRVESTSGDDRGMRGFVTAVVPEDQTPIHWTADSGSTVRCVPSRIRHVEPSDPPGVLWVIADAYGAVLEVRGNERSAVEYVEFWRRQRPKTTYKLFTYGTLAELELAR